MKKKMKNSAGTRMVGRTHAGDIVWSTDGGKPFTMPEGTTMHPVRWRFPWPKRWGYRRLPAPHLNYYQVGTASDKSVILLNALRRGPLLERKGFIHDSRKKIIMTRAVACVVLYWMEGCGVVLVRKPLGNAWTQIDMDVEATRKNNGVVNLKAAGEKV